MAARASARALVLTYRQTPLYSTERLATTPAMVGTVIVTDIGRLLAYFPMEEVLRIAKLDNKEEFYIDIVSATGEEKDFKVKTKHFSRLP